MYCENCDALFESNHCSNCGSKKVREPLAEDFCFLGETHAIWSEALADLLKHNNIPVLTKNELGAVQNSEEGHMFERTRLYVPYSCLKSAKSLEKKVLSGC